MKYCKITSFGFEGVKMQNRSCGSARRFLRVAASFNYSLQGTRRKRRAPDFCVVKWIAICVVVCIIHPMNSADIISRLEREGWQKAHQVGSHIKFKHPGKPGRVTVPHPKKDLTIGTLRSIYRQAGWNWK